MKKNLFKKAAVIALSVATIMTFSFASVFATVADNQQASGSSEGTGTNAAIYLTKQLKMPAGTITPSRTYEFKFAQVYANSVAELAIPNQTIAFDASMEGTTSDGIKTVVKQSANVTKNLTFTQAGVYTYKVTEVDTTTAADATHGETYMANRAYTLRLYVKEATTAGNYYVDKATVIQTTSDVGQAVTEDDANKIDASVTTNGTNGFLFEGKYKEFVATGAFKFENTISDVYKTATTTDTTRTYSVTVTVPTFVVKDIYSKTISGSVAGVATDFTSGTAKSVILAKDQALTFDSLPVGTIITVTDPLTTAMTPSYIQTVGGTSAAAVAGTLGTEQTSTQTIQKGDAISDTNSVMNGYVNGLEFTNTWATMSVTGVVVENMPFILMGIALAGAALLLIMRRREQDEE